MLTVTVPLHVPAWWPWSQGEVLATKAEMIAKEFRVKIISGDWPDGFKLPGQRWTAEKAGVSLPTVQRAYAKLVQEGLLNEPEPGRAFRVASLSVSALAAKRRERLKHRIGEAIQEFFEWGGGICEIPVVVNEALEDKNE